MPKSIQCPFIRLSKFCISSSFHELTFALKLCVKVFWIVYHPNLFSSLGNRSRSRTWTFSFMFFLKGFVISYRPNPLMDLVYIWYDDGFLLKILSYTIPTCLDLRSSSQACAFPCTSFFVKFIFIAYFSHLQKELLTGDFVYL